eukprot:g1303.t1
MRRWAVHHRSGGIIWCLVLSSGWLAFSVGPRLRSSGSGANRGEGAAPITPQQLTGRLKAAETSNHVLFMVEQYENVLNEYHVRAALTRLAQSNGTAALSEDPGFRKLLQRTSELVTTFRSQALATVLWSLARVEYDPGEAFLRSVIDASLPQLQQSKPQELTGARLNFHPGEAFLDAVIARSLKMVESFVLVDIANLLWAFAKLNVSRGEVLRPLLQQAEAQVDSFEPAKLASLLWSCNKLQLDPSLALLRALPFRSNRELTELSRELSQRYRVQLIPRAPDALISWPDPLRATRFILRPLGLRPPGAQPRHGLPSKGHGEAEQKLG